MSYFRRFPKIQYDVNGDGQTQLVTNITKRIAMNSKIQSNTVIFDIYDVPVGDKPEDVAFKYYDDATLHWVILLVNNITDRYHQWPMSLQMFENYLNDKYVEPSATHHYEIEQESGDTTTTINIGTDNTDYPSAVAISNRQYEEGLQEEYGRIRLLRKEYLPQFLKEYKNILKTSD